MHRHTVPAPGIMVWGGFGYHSRTPLVRIAGTLNSQRCISEVLEPVVLPYLQGFLTVIIQQDNSRPHVVCIVQRFFTNRHIDLLPWPTRSPDHSPIVNMSFFKGVACETIPQTSEKGTVTVTKMLWSGAVSCYTHARHYMCLMAAP
ncbi:hypothetical protein LAZ67_23000957 [Cordylochernes scorpioides]|uniref:Transposase n=1 Tax=Cordylochernes scorpioides TaxID=51811 RepID=A0ABY6LQR0_9ARAC|nr:hypothetical protein LAZ67_23000957 [Cordylochernes scorpioides]